MSKTAKQLSYEIADEYLPDVNILGVDGPNTGLADEIINKILDAAVETIKKQPRYMCDVYYNSATPSEDEYGSCLNEDKTIDAINKLRPGQ